jgi:ABC-type sugar transport system substrate-binding protein
MKVYMLAATAAIGLVAGQGALADTADKRIALSNNYAGNSWRQAMLQSWEKVTAPAVAGGVVAAADAFTTAENQVTEQAAQIQNLILQGYDAIVLNAATPEGLAKGGYRMPARRTRPARSRSAPRSRTAGSVRRSAASAAGRAGGRKRK